MSTFYHPYNFIPATGKVNNAKTPTMSSHETRHDLYMNNRFSGRIICELKTITPTIVGNIHKKERENDDASPTLVDLYTWKGKEAIPANSLRGMISNSIEIISQSALRILDREYWPSFATISPDLLPWHDSRRSTSGLTPAELMLGVVEDNDSDKQEDTYSSSLAARVHFYDALPIPGSDVTTLPKATCKEPGKHEPRILLKELGKPEPRAKDAEPGQKPFNIDSGSINNYFEKNSKPLTHREVREALRKKEPLDPRGRKFYLLHEYQDINYEHKNRDEDNRKSKCRLIEKEQEFYFHIDFDNLSEAELTLLKYGLKPDESNFHHRIGLGKSLGLGVIAINICNLFIKDTTQRYSFDFTTSKYHSYQKFNENTNWQLFSRYKLEKEALATARMFQFPENNTFIDQTSLKMFCKIGKYEFLKQQAGTDKSPEQKILVRWRKGYKEYASRLPSLSAGLDKLPIYPIGTKPRSQWLANLCIEDSQNHNWLRQTIAKLIDKDSIEATEEQDINQIILSLALAECWQAIEDPGLKNGVKNIIWQAAHFIDSTWGADNEKHAQAKKIYSPGL